MTHRTFDKSQTHQPHHYVTQHQFSSSVLWKIIILFLNLLVTMTFNLKFKNLLKNLFQHLHRQKKTWYNERSYFSYFSSISTTHLMSPKDSISTQRDDYLTPILSNDNFTFKYQLTSLYMHPTDYTFNLYDKSEDFFSSSASDVMTLYHYWLDNNVKYFSFNLILSHHPFVIWKLSRRILSFFHLLRKQHITLHTPHLSNIKSRKIAFS